MTEYYVIVTPEGGQPVTVTKSGYNVPSIPSLYIRFDDEQIIHRNGLTKGTYQRVPPYTSDIYADGVKVKSYSLPKRDPYSAHYWYSQWIHQIVGPTVKFGPADLVAQGLAVPYGKFAGKIAPYAVQTYSGPMDGAGITQFEPMTGGRPDIAPQPEAWGQFMQTGDPRSVFAWSMGGMSRPIFLMDGPTEKPVDKLARPRAAFTTASYTDDVLTGWPDIYQTQPDSPWTEDQQHQPETFFGTFLICRQPIYAEACQYQALWNLEGSTYFQNMGVKGLDFALQGYGAIRDMAWPLRSILFATKATEMVEADCRARGVPSPSYLLPFATMKGLLDKQLLFLTKFYMQTGLLDEFRCPCNPTYPDFGFLDYLNQTIQLCARHYPADWTAIADWTLPSVTRRVNGKTGWPPACPTAYRVQLTKTGPGGKPWPEGDPPIPMPPDGLLGNWAGDKLQASDFFTWGEAWQNIVAASKATDSSGKRVSDVYNLSVASIDALDKDPYNGMQLAVWDVEAASEAHAVLAIAVDNQRRGIVQYSDPDLEACHDTTHTMLENWAKAAPNNCVPARTSFDPDASLPPVIIPPPAPPPDTTPTTNPPPTEEPPVTDTTQPLAALTAAVHAITTVKDSAVATINGLVQRIQTLINNATASGTQVDPAQLQALVDELNGDKDALATAIAAVPAG